MNELRSLRLIERAEQLARAVPGVANVENKLTVSTESDSGRRGVNYTVEVERAGSTTVGELANSVTPVVAVASDATVWLKPAKFAVLS